MNFHFDPATYPLEKVVKKALSHEDRDFHTACQLLVARKEHANDEVIVVFLGLLAIYSDNLERLTSIVRLLRILPSEATAQRLFEELDGSRATTRPAGTSPPFWTPWLSIRSL